MRILGIDPGLLHTGWAIIDSVGSARHYVASGVILPKTSGALPSRLNEIFVVLIIYVNNFHLMNAV